MLNHVQEHCKGSKNLVKIACGIWQGPNEIQNTLWIKNKCFWTFYYNFFFISLLDSWSSNLREMLCKNCCTWEQRVCVFFIPFLPRKYQINSNDMTEKKLWVDIHTYCMNTNIICTRSWVRTLHKQVFFRNFIHIFLVTSPDTEALFIVPYTISQFT